MAERPISRRRLASSYTSAMDMEELAFFRREVVTVAPVGPSVRSRVNHDDNRYTGLSLDTGRVCSYSIAARSGCRAIQ